MLRLVRHAEVYAPDPLGRSRPPDRRSAHRRDRPPLPRLPAEIPHEEIDLAGLVLSARPHRRPRPPRRRRRRGRPATRVPPVQLTHLSTAGITTVVGVLGTDGTTRSVADLVARTLGLRDEGLTAYCYTGSYELPVPTLTGSVRRDLAFVDPIIGVGELALSDHRSSQPTLDELLRIAADVHVGGMLSGKAGILHLHMGDGPRGLDLVRRALDGSELPPARVPPDPRQPQQAAVRRGLPIVARGG
jgi:beta-aspartyl-dipeptidase (metallo-type)